MPTSRSDSAPKFVPTPAGFKAFFHDLEYCLEKANLTANKDKIRWALHYAGVHGEEWEGVPCLAVHDADPDLETFKADVRESYPQLNENMLYTLGDLEALVDRTRSLSSMSREDLGNYLRSFLVHAGYLVKQGLLSNREKSHLFLTGFPDAMRRSIASRLSIRKRDVPPINGYATEDIQEAAEFVIDRDSYQNHHDFANLESHNFDSRSESSTSPDDIAKEIRGLTQAIVHLTRVIVDASDRRGHPGLYVVPTKTTCPPPHYPGRRRTDYQ